MRAAPDRIFSLAAAVERWPLILPHYRSVRVLEDGPEGRLVEMAAWRGRIPVRWRARQTVDLLRPEIHFRHVWGVTRGMDVRWTFDPVLGSTESLTSVTIHHDLSLAWPLIGSFAADRVIGPYFIDYIARRTLARIKGLVEPEIVHNSA